MKHNPEQGSGWEIRRRFIAPEEAARLGQEALYLIGQTGPFLRSISRDGDGASGLVAHMVSVWNPAEYPEHPDTLLNFPEVADQVPGLLALTRRTASILGKYRTTMGFGINVYEVGGKTRNHRDRRAEEDTIAVGLVGEARLVLKDPATRQKHVFDMEPGDAMHLINPRLQRMRPLHRIFNIGSGQRIAFVK